MTVFYTRGPLNPEEQKNIIIERQELNDILEHIYKRDSYIVLCSPYMTGKTTLLYQIQANLRERDNYGVVYLDLTGLNDLSKNEFYKTICTDIGNRITEFIDPTANKRLAHHDITNQTSFFKYLELLSAYTPQLQKLVFLLDAIHGVSAEVSSTFFPTIRGFFHRGRGISNDRDLYKKVLFIFAGALDLNKLMQGTNSPLVNICTSFTLNDFSQKQVQDLGKKNLKDFTDKQVEQIAKSVYIWCDGHPYLTQRLYGLIDETKKCRSADVKQIPEVVNHLVQNKILDGDDGNWTYIRYYLHNWGESHCNAVNKILRKKPAESIKLVAHDKDLMLIGIIKRSSNQSLIIRNKVYEEALKIFFEHEVRRRGET